MLGLAFLTYHTMHNLLSNAYFSIYQSILFTITLLCIAAEQCFGFRLIYNHISSRAGLNSGCNVCSGNTVTNENSLEAVFPEIAAEWHPTKNIGIDVNDVTFGSAKVVWWRCKNGHEWKANIAGRVRFNSRCRECIWPNYKVVPQK